MKTQSDKTLTSQKSDAVSEVLKNIRKKNSVNKEDLQRILQLTGDE